jgi:RNA polymerase sigma-70 factor, ECF subfamily
MSICRFYQDDHQLIRLKIVKVIIPTDMSDRTNEEWLDHLRTPGPQQEAALADLRAIVIGGLPYALSKWLSSDNPQFEALSQEVAQETLLRVMDRLVTFEGRSKFTTWVHTIAVRIALTELRRQRWKDVSLDGLFENEERSAPVELMAGPGPAPEAIVEGDDLMMRVKQIIMEELTEKQREAMVAIAIRGMPMEEVARRMGTNRNALYKLMHDTRLRVKNRLALEGLTPSDILSVFERE